MKHLGDITKINGAEAPVVNVIIGGSPCQDLSLAGKRKGLTGERSGLFMEQLRIIKEMREADEARGRTDEHIRPRFMVWENVPGAFSTNGGKDFGAVLHETVKIACHNAPPVPMFGNKWAKSGCLVDVDRKWSIAWRVFDAQFWGVPQRRRRIALVADFGGLAAPEILFERKSVSRNFEESETEWKRTIRFAETSSDGAGDGDDSPHMIFGFSENVSSKAGSCGEAFEQAPTLLGSRHDACVVLENHPNDSRRMETGGSNAPLVLQAWCQSAYDEYVSTDKVSTLKAMGGSYNGGSETLIQNDNRIRRLTPLECERLQGFPDSWTNIGEWTDSKGKLHKESSDSARYKALGNSIALPSWFYVLSKLSEFCEEKTMASLFDGIGGFPLIWETLNGKGTCIWASEIEEFPIAVTKHHFGEAESEKVFDKG